MGLVACPASGRGSGIGPCGGRRAPARKALAAKRIANIECFLNASDSSCPWPKTTHAAGNAGCRAERAAQEAAAGRRRIGLLAPGAGRLLLLRLAAIAVIAA